MSEIQVYTVQTQSLVKADGGTGLAIDVPCSQRDQTLFIPTADSFAEQCPFSMTFGDTELDFDPSNPPEPDLISERLLTQDEEYRQAVEVERFLETATDTQIRGLIAQLRA